VCPIFIAERMFAHIAVESEKAMLLIEGGDEWRSQITRR